MAYLQPGVPAVITKIGAAVATSIKPVYSMGTSKPFQIKAVEPTEKKPIMPTTQTQDVANNLRGVHEDGYDSREGFGRPDLNNPTNESKKIAMITKIGNDMLTKEAAGGLAGLLWQGAQGLGKAFASGAKNMYGAVGDLGRVAGRSIGGGVQQFNATAGQALGSRLSGAAGAMRGGAKEAWNALGTPGRKAWAAGTGALGAGYLAFGGGNGHPTTNYNFYQGDPQQFSGSWQ